MRKNVPHLIWTAPPKEEPVGWFWRVNAKELDEEAEHVWAAKTGEEAVAKMQRLYPDATCQLIGKACEDEVTTHSAYLVMPLEGYVYQYG